MVPEKHRKLLVHIRKTAKREKRKRGEEKEGKADIEVREDEVKLGRREKVYTRIGKKQKRTEGQSYLCVVQGETNGPKRRHIPRFAYTYTMSTCSVVYIKLSCC